MPDQHIFEYAVIRVVPRVEREEFLNVGVILFCSKQKFLKFIYKLDEPRLLALSPELDIGELRKNIEAFDHIAAGSAQGGPIAKLDAASRFRWLTAARSTVVQASKVHPGLCKGNAGEKLQRLFTQLVL
ncbi:DUF3037 domain-containing protein [Mucilaginibacter hurinus]|uniref:DUF3037 domain-containing protein n=2 Tax=Mucilaginibacter hurinus TaxID=2201324 RepID=A0A367GLE2_9SPHI|nr:DUF3037 domain-containing protein [Mucilaginibacter hurinus]